MGTRIGDEIVEIEGEIVFVTEKAYLVEPTIGPDQFWLPKSQVVWRSPQPDPDGLVTFHITTWIAGKNGL